MFDLSLKEVFHQVIEERGGKRITLTHFFRPPTEEVWVDYHKGVSQLGLSKGKDIFEVSSTMQEKDEELWEELILRVEGYSFKGKPLMEKENWKDLIPIQHKLAAIGGFMWVSLKSEPETSMEEVSVLDLAEDSLEMSLEVLQNNKVHEIVFNFKNPESKDYIKFNRISSKMQLVRTKQRKVSEVRVPTDIKPFIDLFDRLVESAKGYRYNNKDLMEDPKWRSKVDAYHKREAIKNLFTVSLAEGKEIGI